MCDCPAGTGFDLDRMLCWELPTARAEAYSRGTDNDLKNYLCYDFL